MTTLGSNSIIYFILILIRIKLCGWGINKQNLYGPGKTILQLSKPNTFIIIINHITYMYILVGCSNWSALFSTTKHKKVRCYLPQNWYTKVPTMDVSKFIAKAKAFLNEGLDILEEISASTENEWYINELAQKQTMRRQLCSRLLTSKWKKRIYCKQKLQ